MIIYSCTSELHHPPFVTIGLIVVNVLVFALTAGADPMAVQDYSLWYGQGLHPVQWISSAFLHADATHLIGNMLFLWPFGLLVEGKIGWWKMLALYMLISVSQCAVEQTLMLGYDGGESVEEVFEIMSQDPNFKQLDAEDQAAFREVLQAELAGVRHSLGASSAIFGLLAVCILWAPSSDFNVWWRFGSFEVPVLVVGGFYALFEFWKWHTSGFGVGSAALHLLGLVSGLGVGIAYLRYDIPKCDGQDIFSEIFNRPIRRQRRAKSVPAKRQRQDFPKPAPAAAVTPLPTPAPIHPAPAHQALADLDDLPAPDDSWLNELSGLPVVDDRITKATQAAESGQVMEAAKIIYAIDDAQVLQQIPLEKFSSLYKQAVSAKQFQAAAAILQKSIVAYPQRAESRKLQLAKLMLLALNKPQQAKSILAKLQRADLSPDQAKLFRSLVDKLRQSAG